MGSDALIRAEPELADFAVNDRREIGGGGVQARENRLSVSEQHPSGLGEPHRTRPAGPVEHARSHELLQRDDLLAHGGPPTPRNASHEGWREWFTRLGDAIVDVGSPMVNGIVARGDGSTSEATARLNGYSIVQAEDKDEALELVQDHPLLALGDEYAIEIFELPRKSNSPLEGATG
jgi:hypothetical protein